jgi:hypothetical protein
VAAFLQGRFKSVEQLLLAEDFPLGGNNAKLVAFTGVEDQE